MSHNPDDLLDQPIVFADYQITVNTGAGIPSIRHPKESPVTQRVFDRTFAANYPGPMPSELPDTIVGPNTMGEYFRPMGIEPLPAGGYRIEYDVLRPQDGNAELRGRAAGAFRRARIAALFGGSR